MCRALQGLVAAFVLLISTVAAARLDPRAPAMHHDTQRRVIHTDAAEADRVKSLPGWKGVVHGLFSGAGYLLCEAVQPVPCNSTMLPL